MMIRLVSFISFSCLLFYQRPVWLTESEFSGRVSSADGLVWRRRFAWLWAATTSSTHCGPDAAQRLRSRALRAWNAEGRNAARRIDTVDPTGTAPFCTSCNCTVCPVCGIVTGPGRRLPLLCSTSVSIHLKKKMVFYYSTRIFSLLYAT